MILIISQVLHDYDYSQEDEVGGSNERYPLTSNFDAKEIHEAKQSTILIATSSPRQTGIKLIA